MTPAEIQTSLKLPYARERWRVLLAALFPQTQGFSRPIALPIAKGEVKSAFQLASIRLADGKNVAVIEVEVDGRVDLQRNRVGLRNIVAALIDQDKAHGVIGLFRGEEGNDGDYRLSFVAKSSEFSADGALSRTETEKRRYTYILGRGQPCRTPAERLNGLQKKGAAATLDDLMAAFKVEPLFKEFYRDYHRLFEEVVKPAIQPSLPDKEQLHLFTQRLFNRLMFLAFIERKGWLRIGRRTDYLEALWDDYIDSRDTSLGFYQGRLAPLFFEGLNQPDRPSDHKDPRFGSVPYLNGGLFDKAEDGTDDPLKIIVPDEALKAVKEQLFDRYNFTVAESTPLDVEVAVDPEMLGKVFEELVTGRHEQGSYYTPKPIVSFMCREALVGYLATRCKTEHVSDIEAFVHDHQPAGLRDAEAILRALREVTVCDPACGSGAYLLGMLHELLDLRTCLFAANQKLDGVTAHARKLEIIERNLYGVDKDAFAVNIARLRLWLSLSVEYDGNSPPPALPNLDFKIEQGDSLAAPAPAEVFKDAGDLPILLPTVRQFAAAKNRFLTEHGKKKAATRQEIIELKDSLKTWLATDGPPDAFHWAIEFAEIFLPARALPSLTGGLNLGLELAPAAMPGGFDIVVANPPYVRMELIKPQKPVLRKRFPQVHAERADLYVYFYARAHDLLRDGGTAAFISSNKWLRAGYGESLRQHLLDTQSFGIVMDFGDLPVFESATAYPCIFIWKKELRGKSTTRWASVKDLEECYAEGVRAHFLRLTVSVPATQFGKGKSRLATIAVSDLRTRMEKSGPRLGQLCKGVLGWGVKTGLNEAFIISQTKREELVSETPAAAEIIKPLIEGDNVRRFEIQYRGLFLIYAYHGLDILKYPSVEVHLRPFRSRLEGRATKQEWFELQQPQMAYREHFTRPKIVYPDIGKELRFALDTEGYFGANTTYFLPLSDWFVCAAMNTSSVRRWIEGSLNDLRGGYLRFFGQHMEQIPIPAAPEAERVAIGALAERAQALHGQRRARVERFLRELGVDPAASSSRNPLEQPWSLPPAEFIKRAKPLQRAARERPQLLYEGARDETASLTEQIAKLEAEIDTRVATLYGLDAEDQRWAAKAAPAAQPDDKSALFFRILGGLKERSAYFSHKAIQVAVNEAELQIEDAVLNVYLTQATKQGLIHDAGRGWYSRLSVPMKLEVKLISKLVLTLEKAFPLLDFHCWSTAQINPWMHHLIGQGVAFVNTDAEAMEAVADCLRDAGYDVHLNPTGKAREMFAVRGNTVVIRKRVIGASEANHCSKFETLLVDLWMESDRLRLMDRQEFRDMAARGVLSGRISVTELSNYATNRKQNWEDLFRGEGINQRHLFEKGDVG